MQRRLNYVHLDRLTAKCTTSFLIPWQSLARRLEHATPLYSSATAKIEQVILGVYGPKRTAAAAALAATSGR